MFQSKTYIQRRKCLNERMESGIAIFLGHDESPINFIDNTYPFRQDSTFLYYFGHNLPRLTGVVDFDEGVDYLFGDDIGIDDLIWRGSQPTIKELGDRIGVSKIGTIKEYERFIEKTLSYNRKIHFLPPYRAEIKLKLLKHFGNQLLQTDPFAFEPSAFESSIAEFSTSEFYASRSSKKISLHPSIDLIKAVVAQREIKTDQEIVQIEEAVNISVDMHIEAMKIAKQGMTEQDVVSVIYKKMVDSGVSMAFTPIATTRGEILHNHFYGNILKNGDLFLLDAGVENSMHYASDLSSTFPVDSKFTTIQKDIYTITLHAHEAAIEALVPGVPFKDVHFKASKTIVQGLKSIGLMKGDVDEAVELGVHALFFPCGTGHMMGLDVHDMEDFGEVYVGYNGEAKSRQFGLKSLRLAKPLKPGFVLTIEPGIYFIPALIDKWRTENKFVEFINYQELESCNIASYRAFGGIRNEENFLITEKGARLLGKNKPKSVEEIELLR